MSSRGGNFKRETQDMMSSEKKDDQKIVFMMQTWVWRQCVVESALFLQNLLRILFYATIQDFIFVKACTVDLGYSSLKCAALLNRSTSNMKGMEEEAEVQRKVGTVLMWRTVFETTFPIFLALVIGAWSDKYGRKHLMLLNLFACLVESSGLVVCVYCQSSVGAWTVAVVSSFITSFSGGFFCFKTAILNHISDTTSVELRTTRLGFANSLLVGGKIIGLVMAAMFAESCLGFETKFASIACTEAFLFVYILYTVPNIRGGKVLKGNKVSLTMIKDIFDVDLVKDSVRTIMKIRPENGRRTLLTFLIVHSSIMTPLFGEAGVMFLFTRFRFNWNSADLAYFLTYREILRFLGNFLVVPLFSRVWKLPDKILGVIACFTAILASIPMSYGTQSAFFLGPLLGLLSSAAIVIPRSQISKLVPSEEMGKIGAFIAAMDCFNLLCSELMYTSVYTATFDLFPGAIFILSSIFWLLSALLLRLN